MSSSPRLTPRIYHDWENMEIKNLNFLLTLIWVGGVILLPCWFSLNNSETVEAFTTIFWHSAETSQKIQVFSRRRANCQLSLVTNSKSPSTMKIGTLNH